MTEQKLYREMKAHLDGSLEPTFALNSSCHWMRALAVLCGDSVPEFTDRPSVKKSENGRIASAMHLLLQSRQCVASLREFQGSANPHSLSSAAVVQWYYGVYFGATAMVQAKCDAIHDSHSKTAAVWLTQFADIAALAPFNLHVTTLVAKDSDGEIESIAGPGRFDLNSVPTNESEATGSAATYLKGTAKWYREKQEARIKKNHKLDSFRKKTAQNLRDDELRKSQCGFIHQAFRFRGKANYRDGLYLAYGNDNTTKLTTFIKDLYLVAERFSLLAGFYCRSIIPKTAWNDLSEDILVHSKVVSSDQPGPFVVK